MQLTPEQADIVTENHNLIYWYIGKHNLSLEEYYDLLAIELCYTVANHDPSKGSLSNHFKLRADWCLSREHKKSQTQKRMHTSIRLTDNIDLVDDIDVQNLIEINDWLDGDGDDYTILKMKSKGYNQTEIAHKMGLSQSYISKILKRLKKEWLDVNN